MPGPVTEPQFVAAAFLSQSATVGNAATNSLGAAFVKDGVAGEWTVTLPADNAIPVGFALVTFTLASNFSPGASLGCQHNSPTSFKITIRNSSTGASLDVDTNIKIERMPANR